MAQRDQKKESHIKRKQPDKKAITYRHIIHLGLSNPCWTEPIPEGKKATWKLKANSPSVKKASYPIKDLQIIPDSSPIGNKKIKQ